MRSYTPNEINYTNTYSTNNELIRDRILPIKGCNAEYCAVGITRYLANRGTFENKAMNQ